MDYTAPYKTKALEGGGLSVVFSGVVSREERIEAHGKIYGKPPKFNTVRYAISDFSGVEKLDYSDQDTQRLAAVTKAAFVNDPEKFAAVVAAQDFLFGKARAWGGRLGGAGTNFMVFRTRQEAHDWVYKKLHGK